MTRKQTDNKARTIRQCGQLIMSPAGIGLLLQRQLEHPPLFGALASIENGKIARVRMMALGDFNIRNMTLLTSADRRSAKVRQLRAYSKAELCIWLPDLTTQLRLLLVWRVIAAGLAGITKSDRGLYAQLWQRRRLELQHLYDGPPPGQRVSMPRHNPPPEKEALYDPSGLMPPRNFAVLLGRIIAIDALVLSVPEPQRYRHRRISDRWETLKINS
ncbi:MAG: pyridoxamine 5'-phosphate oxidase family protein [Phycisphaerae bacterium]